MTIPIVPPLPLDTKWIGACMDDDHPIQPKKKLKGIDISGASEFQILEIQTLSEHFLINKMPPVWSEPDFPFPSSTPRGKKNKINGEQNKHKDQDYRKKKNKRKINVNKEWEY